MEFLREAMAVLHDAHRAGVEFYLDEDDVVIATAPTKPSEALLDRLWEHSVGVMLLFDAEPPTESVH